MITVKIDEDILLEMLLDRVEYWISDKDIINLYRDYYEELINSGCFEDHELNVMNIVDNDYVNNLETISKEDFEQWNIEDVTDDKIVASNEAEDLYLIRAY